MSSSNKCPKCKEEILPGAKKCKHCQADLRNWFVKHKILTGILVLLGIAVLGSAFNNPDTTKTANTSSTGGTVESSSSVETPVVVTAVDLAKAYEENEVKADKEYKGKTLEITGTVKDIGTVLSQTYVVLASGEEFSITDIQCLFDNQAEIDKVAELTKGSQITVQGKVDGKSLNVSVKGCVLK